MKVMNLGKEEAWLWSLLCQAPGVGDGQGSLVCCSPGVTELDMTEWLNWTDWHSRELEKPRLRLIMTITQKLSSFTTNSKHSKFQFMICFMLSCSVMTVCDPMDYSPPGSSVHGVFQVRILEWVAISFSRLSSQPRNQPVSPALQADSSLAELPDDVYMHSQIIMSFSASRGGQHVF